MTLAFALVWISACYSQSPPSPVNRNAGLSSVLTAKTLPSRRQDFDRQPVYLANDLGANYTPKATTFKVWAPTAESVTLNLFGTNAANTHKRVSMAPSSDGVWIAVVQGDQHLAEYLYEITHEDEASNDLLSYLVADPYSKACTANSQRSMVVDLRQTDPADWNQDSFVQLKCNTDAILYELHVRDFSIHPTSGVSQASRGKYSGVYESGTRNLDGLSTGIDHLSELGITHVHLLPIQDYPFGQEKENPDSYSWYDWGYGTTFFQTPEGSYASNPDDLSRQRELKQLVKEFHKRKLGVVLDIVFNHTAATGTNQGSIFDMIAPHYFYRFNDDGTYSSASGCGNDLATERPMVRKFILDTVRFWMEEYHIDGFRFDLMGLIDRETMLAVYREAKRINPNALIYGEGWDMERNLPAEQMMTQAYVQGTDIAAFNDGLRDTIKGPVWDAATPGLVQTGVARQGREAFIGNLKAQITASNIKIDSPNESIQYASSHDDHCLWDKINLSAVNETESNRVKMHRLSLGIVLTSQGVPFLHAGDEFLRSKNGVKNSYNSNDPDVNPIQWSLKNENKATYEYHRGLIELRRKHPAFRMTSRSEVDKHFQIINQPNEKVYAYRLIDAANQDEWAEIVVIFNTGRQSVEIPVLGDWNIVVNGERTGTHTLNRQKDLITVSPISILVAHKVNDQRD